MKVQVAFGSELEPALQNHLDSGVSVQEYIRRAIVLYNEVRRLEALGHTVGYSGVKELSRFKQYNTVIDLEKLCRSTAPSDSLEE